MDIKLVKIKSLLLIPAILLCSWSIGAAAEQEGQGYYYDAALKRGYVKVTGTGLYPKKYAPGDARQRMMARRAAVVDAYRKIGPTYGIVVREVYGRGDYNEHTSGFMSGVEVTQTRYYDEQGRAEVDAIMPVNGTVATRNWNALAGNGIKVYEVEDKTEVITEEEYRKLLE